eukprot:symbB.v1.2.028300.t1/scaffold2985.1/size65860/4
MSSGLPSSLGRTSKAGESSTALAALAECRRQREQQEQLLLKAQEELQKAARLAKTAIERRVGGPEPPEVAERSVTMKLSPFVATWLTATSSHALNTAPSPPLYSTGGWADTVLFVPKGDENDTPSFDCHRLVSMVCDGGLGIQST